MKYSSALPYQPSTSSDDPLSSHKSRPIVVLVEAAHDDTIGGTCCRMYESVVSDIDAHMTYIIVPSVRIEKYEIAGA